MHRQKLAYFGQREFDQIGSRANALIWAVSTFSSELCRQSDSYRSCHKAVLSATDLFEDASKRLFRSNTTSSLACDHFLHMCDIRNAEGLLIEKGSWRCSTCQEFK
ncbi:unnamed protein product [Auanema sp. JU1783]|nr:unnamed protein product [Auanema sp. JU1783]